MNVSRIYVDPHGRTTVVIPASTRKKYNLKNKDKVRIDDSQEDRILICLKEKVMIEVSLYDSELSNSFVFKFTDENQMKEFIELNPRYQIEKKEKKNNEKTPLNEN